MAASLALGLSYDFHSDGEIKRLKNIGKSVNG